MKIKLLLAELKSFEKMNRWKESNWVTNDWDKITRLDFSECTLNNSYCLNNLKKFLSDFLQHNVKTTRLYIWEWTYLYNRSLSNNTYDFTFKEWNWFSYFSNRCLILLRLWSQLLINKFFIKYLWSSKKTLTIFAVIKV